MKARPKLRVDSKRLKDLVKDESVIVGPLARYFEQKGPEDTGRRTDCIHPSALCREDFCVRAAYYEITGAPVLHTPATSFRLHQIFDEGHFIHDKWQQKLWSMGGLKGDYECLACGLFWFDNSPDHCPYCYRDRRVLAYREVLVDGRNDYLIEGRADGWVGEDLLEFKSLGKGTLRIEAPTLYAQHTHKVMLDGEERTWVDLEGMWKNFRRPIGAHLRQGMLYLHFTKLKRIVFIYEAKWDQAYKEFVIRYQPDIVEPMLDMALDVKYAIEKKKLPACTHGGMCVQCRIYEESSAEPDEKLDIGIGTGDRQGPAGDGAGRVSRPRTADLRHTNSAVQSVRSIRR